MLEKVRSSFSKRRLEHYKQEEMVKGDEDEDAVKQRKWIKGQAVGDSLD